jgi:hypothetical protein
MRAIAKRGENTYLLIPGDDPSVLGTDPRPVARVYDGKLGILCVPHNAHRILARGYWKETDLDDAQVRQLLTGVKEVQGSPLDEPWIIERGAREPATRAA